MKPRSELGVKCGKGLRDHTLLTSASSANKPNYHTTYSISQQYISKETDSKHCRWQCRMNFAFYSQALSTHLSYFNGSNGRSLSDFFWTSPKNSVLVTSWYINIALTIRSFRFEVELSPFSIPLFHLAQHSIQQQTLNSDECGVNLSPNYSTPSIYDGLGDGVVGHAPELVPV